ncbi:hypothetical protein WICPIJ_005403 [Wickerhamomyces pijperi]|uniref:GATA-type domain-containing protein n=1 Tax=Wickerhamomyces pijperi TaxID=599730 RepID=A0A9P8Q3Y1_WICPI|nr:hypothetical protein WICPIJ_005403 [Wickerhamomyces pijperi]
MSLPSNLLPSMVSSSSSSEITTGRKRYLDDLELPPLANSTHNSHKRVKTAGSSLPSSPSEQQHTFTSPNLSQPLIHQSSTSSTANSTFYQYQYLSHSESRYHSSVTKHSLDYPDTCINDEDWRYNLEFWINKNFPEKFHNLKTALKSDKPGFDLLNDAIFINELKDQVVDQSKPLDKTPKFTSHISRKMTASYNRDPASYSLYSSSSTSYSTNTSRFYSRASASPKAVLGKNGSLSEDEYAVPSSSAEPLRHTSTKQTKTPASASATPSSYYHARGTSATSLSASNYTYTNGQLLSPPMTNASLASSSSSSSAKLQHPLNSPKVSLPSLNVKGLSQTPNTAAYPHSPESLIHNQSKPMSSPVYRYQDSTTTTTSKDTSHSKPTSPTTSQPNSPNSSPSKANFVHTTPHKGPNHSYTIHQHHLHKRQCISCHSDQSPCWRPSWSLSAGQLCNSCGLRYKKTGARCTNSQCGRIPAKGEWTSMKSKGKVNIHDADGVHKGYKCLHCDSEVEVKVKNDPKP